MTKCTSLGDQVNEHVSKLLEQLIQDTYQAYFHPENCDHKHDADSLPVNDKQDD